MNFLDNYNHLLEIKRKLQSDPNNPPSGKQNNLLAIAAISAALIVGSVVIYASTKKQ